MPSFFGRTRLSNEFEQQLHGTDLTFRGVGYEGEVTLPGHP